MSKPFHALEDRRFRLFGREGDVDALLRRSAARGLTVISGRPRMGKTWLLEEVCRRLESDLGYLVGYFECPGGLTDMPLRAVADAYARWLSGATFKNQAKSLLDRHRSSLASKVGLALGTFLSKAAEETLSLPLRSAIEELFERLAAADRDLKTGGLPLRPLPYEQTRDLVSLLARLSGQPVVLVLDQWEKSEGWERELALIDTYLRHPEDWPDGHLFAAIRVGEQREGVQRVQRLVRQWPAASDYSLGGMKLVGREAVRTTSYLRSQLPVATRNADQDRLLALVDGYPGVLDQWLDDVVRAQLTTLEDLTRRANDAQANRFPEIELELARLNAENRGALGVAIRVALLPAWDDWALARPLAFRHEEDEAALTLLHDRGVLSRQSFDLPTFGHDTKREIALDWFYRNVPALTRNEAQDLINRAASRVRSVDFKSRFAEAVIEVFARAQHLGLPHSAEVIYHSSCSLFGLRSERAREVLSQHTGAVSQVGGVPQLLAKGLFNTLNDAKGENELERRDALLDELRRLAGQHPDDAEVRELLARGLFNTLNDAKDENKLERRDVLLDDLRQLAGQHPDDAALCKELASGLFNTLNDAKDENELGRRDALLDELRQLAAQHPDDAEVRQLLAKGLLNTLKHAKDENELERRDALLEELRQLAAQHPDNGAVRRLLAIGLFMSLIRRRRLMVGPELYCTQDIPHPMNQNDLERRDALLDELRQLAAQHPDDAVVGELFASLRELNVVGFLNVGFFKGGFTVWLERSD